MSTLLSILVFGWQKTISQDSRNALNYWQTIKSFGNDYSFILDGLLRYEYRSHAIYYQRNQHDILIIRVLGSNQDPARNIQ